MPRTLGNMGLNEWPPAATPMAALRLLRSRCLSALAPQGTRGQAQVPAALPDEVRCVGEADAESDLRDAQAIKARVAEHAARHLHAKAGQRGRESGRSFAEAA